MARKSYVDVPLGDVRQIQLDDGRIILEGIDPETGRKPRSNLPKSGARHRGERFNPPHLLLKTVK